MAENGDEDQDMTEDENAADTSDPLPPFKDKLCRAPVYKCWYI